MSRRLRSLKRNIRENITKIPSVTNIAKGTLKGTYNAAVSAKNAAVSAKDSTVSGVKKTYFGKYEDEYLNENARNTQTDDIQGSAWIKVYDVAIPNKDKEDEIQKLLEKVGKRIELISEKQITDDTDDTDDNDDNYVEKLIKHIKEKKYTEKIGIRNVARTFETKKIVIPYDNIDEDDFDVNNLKDGLLEGLKNLYKNLNKYYIEIEENGILNYYISTSIKKYLRYAIVKRGKDKDNTKKKKELAKKEKQKKLDSKKSEANKILDDIGVDILSDNKIDVFPPFPPCSKLANAYCYIHPFNVILYEKKIMYGLKWEKVNFNPEESDYLYEDIEKYFQDNNDDSSLNLFKEKFEEEYKKLQPSKPAPEAEAKEAGEAGAGAEAGEAEAAGGGEAEPGEAEAKTGGKQIGGDTEVIDLTGVKEVRDIVNDAKYLNDFKSEKFYYKYGGDNIYYLCKNSILDYRYNHKSWNKEEYYNDNSINKAGLQFNLNSIKELNNDLTSALEKLREKARENGDINKYKEEERQDRSDERFNDNAGKVGFYTTQLFVYTAKYIQDTFLAGIKVLFSSSWNNVITGFLILLFIILVIIMGVALGGGGDGGGNAGPNKKPKEENKDFISLLKSLPAHINSAYADFNNFATDFGNMVTNGRRAVNDFTDAITGDNVPEDLVRNKYDENDVKIENKGRGGDNIIHFDVVNDVISAYKPIAKIIPKQNGINSNGEISETDFVITTDPDRSGELYMLDCNNPNTSNYFTKSCKIRKDYGLDTRFIKEPESDYEQIKIND